MRRLFRQLANGIRHTNEARPAKRGPRRTLLRVEALEDRQLLSGSPLSPWPPWPPPPPGPGLDPIQVKYQFLGGANGILGQPTSGEMATPYGNGLYETFQNGAIFYSRWTGAHDVLLPTENEYFATAGERDAGGTVVEKLLGLPTTDEVGVPGVLGATVTTFQGGQIYYSPWTGAHDLYGAIGAEYAATASETDAGGRSVQGVLGLPTSDEADVPGIPGARRNTFQGGTISWSAATGAHVVYGAIGAEYAATANERDGGGRVVQQVLGLPTSDELAVPGGAGGRMNSFQGGVIYWSPTTGAHEVYGLIGQLWAALGWEGSFLGYPVTNEMDAPGGRISYFQHGTITWNAATNGLAFTRLNILHVHAIRVSDSDGTFAANITPPQVKEFVDRANVTYAGTGVQFAFDPNDAQDFSTVANDQVNRMYYGGAGYNPAADPAQAIAAQYPDQLPVFFRAGYEKDGNGKRTYTGNGFSGKNYNYVAMPGYTPWQLGLFAHETGHYLGLRHTFVGDGDNVTDTLPKLATYILGHGGTAAAADGDNVILYPGDDAVTDTNPDPGAKFYRTYISTDLVNGPASFTVSVTLPGLGTFSWTFTPPRSNLMSYYNWTNQTVTADQAGIMNKWYRMRFLDHTWQAGAYVVGNSGNGGEDDTNLFGGGHGGGCGCPFCQALAAAAAADPGGAGAGAPAPVAPARPLGTAPTDGGPLRTTLSGSLAVGAPIAGDRGGLKAAASLSPAVAGGRPAGYTALAVPVRDVTAQLALSYGSFVYDATTGHYQQAVTLTNTSGKPITGPLSLVLDGLGAGRKLVRPTGKTAGGSPYVDVALEGDVLDVGQSVTVVLEFVSPGGALTYTARALAGSGPR